MWSFHFTALHLHSCAWCSVRSSLHTSGAHLTAPLCGAIAMGAMLPPTPFHPPHAIAKKYGWAFGCFGFSM